MASPSPRVSAPAIEHHPDGFGIGHRRPRISWRFLQPDDGSSNNPDHQGWTQYAYELHFDHGPGSNKEFLYRVEGAESVLVPWPDGELASRERRTVRVRAFGRPASRPRRDEALDATAWSPTTDVEATLLAREDWTASFIAAGVPFQEPNAPLRPVYFRKAFRTLPNRGGDVVRARLYVTAHGAFSANLDGHLVGDHELAPGWTSYHHRLVFHTFDVTDIVRSSGGGDEHVLSAEVAEGWYAGRLSVRGGRRYIWGAEVALLVQLELAYASGETQTLVTDASWKCHPSATLTAEIYDGEVYDAGQEQPGWTGTPFDDSAWLPVKTLPFTKAELVAPDAPPIRAIKNIAPVRIFQSPSGKTLLDFGQNLVGIVRVPLMVVPAGTTITLLHAEVLGADGELARAPLREAQCRDVFIGGRSSLVVDWRPRYTFHGFRFVQVDGLDATVVDVLKGFTACVLHSDMRRRGRFACSDARVNRLHANAVWGMRGNLLGVPTDCPQRDERLGWTGDLQIIAPSLAFVFDCTGVLASWLADVDAEQCAKGNGIPGAAVPDILPAAWAATPQAVWHDVVVLTPWDLYGFTADDSLLRRQLAGMRAWLDAGVRRGPDGLWDPDLWQLGDWLDPAAPGDDPGRGLTDGTYVADAYLVRVTATLARVCAVLDLTELAAAYAADAARLRAAFQHKYVTPAGRVAVHTQTALALALQFSLVPGTARRTVQDALARLVRRDRFRVTTGLVGTSLVAPALTAAGDTALAYRMLFETACPSFLYPITMGATTIWERWNSLLPDGSVYPDPMVSFNHYALGSIIHWLHTSVAGLRSDDGWHTVVVRPEPGGPLTHAEASFDGPYGLVRARWDLTANNGTDDGYDAGQTFSLDLTVPPNSSAVVTLPGASAAERSPRTVGSGTHNFRCQYGGCGRSNEPWPPKPLLPFFRPEGITWAVRLGEEGA